MVAQFRAGAATRAVARAHAVSLSTVQWWVRRAGDRALDQVEWDDRPPLAKQIHRTASAVEDVVLTLRRELKDTSDLGEYGARAIHHALTACARCPVPSVRTIGRILARRGALDAGRRLRRPPPPSGWYLPAVAGRRAELDSFDTIEGFIGTGLSNNHDTITAATIMMSRETTRITIQRGTAPQMPSATKIETSSALSRKPSTASLMPAMTKIANAISIWLEAIAQTMTGTRMMRPSVIMFGILVGILNSVASRLPA